MREPRLIDTLLPGIRVRLEKELDKDAQVYIHDERLFVWWKYRDVSVPISEVERHVEYQDYRSFDRVINNLAETLRASL